MATEEIYNSDPTPEDLTDNDDRPLIELFVKAGVDHMQNGGCPMCHRYFLVFYILRQNGLIDLVVTTFRTDDVPPEVKAFSSGKQYPLVKVHRGTDSNGLSMIDTTCDTVPEIEDLLDRFDCSDVKSVKESTKEEQAEKMFADLYRKFKGYLNGQSGEQPLLNILEKIDEHLKETGNTFLLGDNLTRADCYLLPTLQHLRVAGKFYKNFEIPTEYECLWRYLHNAYSTEAMTQSTPADREIIRHYEGKTEGKSSKKTHSTLMKEARTMSVPDSIAKSCEGAGGTNGIVQEEQLVE